MAPTSTPRTSSRRTASGRSRGRPKTSGTSAARVAEGLERMGLLSKSGTPITPLAGTTASSSATPATIVASTALVNGTSATTTTPGPPTTTTIPAAGAVTEPPPKRRRYIPGGPGGGGRWYVSDEDGTGHIIPANPGSSSAAREQKAQQRRQSAGGTTRRTPSTRTRPVLPSRSASTRIRRSVQPFGSVYTTTGRGDKDDDDDDDDGSGTGRGSSGLGRAGSAAAAAAAAVQSEGYKPREERGWEEFHPSLDIEQTFMVFRAEDVDGTASVAPATAAAGTPTATPVQASSATNGSATPVKDSNPASTRNTPAPVGATAGSTTEGPASAGPSTSTAPVPPPPVVPSPIKRRPGRPPRDPNAYYYGTGATPRKPQVLPIFNQTPKERLELKQPSYRKTDRILLFESKQFGQARYVDKAMANAGYQESDNFIRPERTLIKASDAMADEEFDALPSIKLDGEGAGGSASAPSTSAGGVVHSASIGRVEYDMDEQDDMWLESYNAQRRQADVEPITREIFEITITKIEKEWHALEKRIPKPNPKPPQTHRPRSSSAAAVNGEPPPPGEEQDSKCAICDDGDCENTNAIVFCDGCDLAVHQECYGVPFIPEGQWLCRKCQLIGRGIPTCIFCPNTDGAFKQTNSSKWAHLLCAMWIPEVSLGNHTFMEPVMDVEKVPKNRWKLSCYICHQKMGACIQCGNKACYQAFHVTCARRARLYLKMKNSHGALAVLDSHVTLKAFCDKHCPQEYAKENNVAQATKLAKKFYKRRMRGRIWAHNQASALQLAATHRNAITEHPANESQMLGSASGRASAASPDKKKGSAPPKNVWKLPSGAPVIPQAVFEVVDAAMSRFALRRRKEYVAEACRYWTLKREARRGAALLKRLQLQMETFSSMELTRRNFASIGPSGKQRLIRRIEFAKMLIGDLERLQELSQEVVERERVKLDEAELELDFVDTCYFPISRLLLPVVERAASLDKKVFKDGLDKLQSKLEQRFYTTTLAFAHDFCEIINVGINTDPKPVPKPKFELMESSPTKQNYNDRRERKRLAKRIIKAVQPHLLQALQAEMDIKRRPMADAANELEGMLEASLEMQQSSVIVTQDAGAAESQDVIMVDVSEPAEAAQITVATDAKPAVDGDATGDNSAGSGDDGREADNADEEMQGAEDNMEAKSTGLTAKPVNGILSSSSSVQGQQDADTANTDKPSAGDAVAAPAASKPTDTPPSEAQVSVTGQPSQQAIAPPGPPTPPRSHGSLGFASSAPTDPLTDGGVPWYLQSFDPQGTTVEDDEEPEFEQEMLRQQQPHQEQQQEQEQEEQPKQQWTSGRDAVLRSLSEDLTDMDDEELKGLLHDDGPAATNSDDDAGKEPRKKTATNSRLSVPVVVAGSRSSARLNRAAAAASNGTASPSKTRSPAADKVAGAPATRAAVAAAAMPMVDDKNEKSDDEEDGDANDDDDDDDDAVASVSASASPARPRSRASAAATSSPVKIKTYANRVRKRTRTSTRRR